MTPTAWATGLYDAAAAWAARWLWLTPRETVLAVMTLLGTACWVWMTRAASPERSSAVPERSRRRRLPARRH